jgi:hypothetical protein
MSKRRLANSIPRAAPRSIHLSFFALGSIFAKSEKKELRI